MKKLLFSTLAGVFMLAGASGPVQALSITPDSGVLNVTRWEGDDTSQAAIDAVIAPILGSSIELYKDNVESGEEGSLAGSYETTYFNSPTDPEDFLIEYISGPIVGPTAYLLVKDGAASPAWYLFNLTALGWDGMEDIVGTGFWPGTGAVSHVALYGGEDDPGPDPDPIPEPTTLALFGLGLLGAGVARRRR